MKLRQMRRRELAAFLEDRMTGGALAYMREPGCKLEVLGVFITQARSDWFLAVRLKCPRRRATYLKVYERLVGGQFRHRVTAGPKPPDWTLWSATAWVGDRPQAMSRLKRIACHVQVATDQRRRRDAAAAVAA